VSLQEIEVALSGLTAEELAHVEATVRAIRADRNFSSSAVVYGTGANGTLETLLSEVAEMVQDLPADLAAQHDHYIHGTPKR
jgi:hypothetical protein